MVLVKQEDHGNGIITCAEAPPDVGEAFASAIADKLKDSLTDKMGTVKAELANDYASV